MNARRQLEALASVDAAFAAAGIAYWVFGGWAVDFHAGAITRRHDDVDLAVWLHDLPRIAELLRVDRWRHAPEPDEDGGTGYERDGVRLELTFLEIDGDGVYTPLRNGRARWPAGALGDDVLELRGARARVIGREALVRMKTDAREDPGDAAKDRADAQTLQERERPAPGPASTHIAGAPPPAENPASPGSARRRRGS